jgi:hypothetical protein
LIRNTARQSMYWVSSPPSTGPYAAKKAEAPATIPSARPRSRCGKTALTMASVVGNINAAPTPWVARTVISQSISCAAPAIAEDPMKSTAPLRKTRLSPSWSPNRPAKTMKAARGKILAVSIHWEVESDPPRAAMVCGIASGTAVWSTRIMLLARVIATRVNLRARSEESVMRTSYNHGRLQGQSSFAEFPF